MKQSKINGISAMVLILVLCGFSFKTAKTGTDPNLKQVLLVQLKSTHNVKDWFVPANIAIEGLTAEHAMWNDKSNNHSIGQLTRHLIFWNELQLIAFKEIKGPDFSGNNEETFATFDKNTWSETV